MQDRKYYFKISLIFYAIWIVSFQIVGRYAATLNTHDPTMAIDQMIPLLPDFIWFYELCYIFPLFPLFVIQDFHRLNITLLSIILANVSAFVVYLVYPVAFPRPELGQSIAEKILNLEYATDFYPGANKLPSMHVTFAWFVYFAVRGQKLGKIGEMFIFFLTVMITISTLFVKQHIVMDVAAGVLWALLTWELAKYLYPLLANSKLEPRVALNQMLKNTGIFVAYLVVFWIALPLLLIIVGEAASSLYPIALPNHPFLYFCGILLIASGGALFFLSSKQLAEQGQGLPVSHIHPRKLVRSGPYRYLRHPIYVGYTLLWAGFACLVGSFWMLTISLLLLIAGWLLYAHYFEEKILQRRFGDQYTSYRNKTPIILIKPDRRK